MEPTKFEAVKQRWNRPPAQPAATTPEVRRAPDPAEAASFGAFFATHQQVAQKTGRG